MERAGYERKLEWQRAMNLVELIYRLTSYFPVDEKSGLTATLRRIVTGAAAKIAEGCSTQSSESLASAQTSLRELVAYLIICRRLKYISNWKLSSLKRRCEKLVILLDKSNITLQKTNGEEDTRLRQAA